MWQCSLQAGSALPACCCHTQLPNVSFLSDVTIYPTSCCHMHLPNVGYHVHLPNMSYHVHLPNVGYHMHLPNVGYHMHLPNELLPHASTQRAAATCIYPTWAATCIYPTWATTCRQHTQVAQVCCCNTQALMQEYITRRLPCRTRHAPCKRQFPHEWQHPRVAVGLVTGEA